MIHQRLQLAALTVIFAIIGLVAVFMWWPFFKLLALAVILATLFLPIYRRLVKKVKNEPAGALLTILLILLIVIVPLYFIGQILFNELVDLYNQYKGGELVISKTEIIANLPEQFRGPATNFLQDLAQKMSSFASNAFEGVTSILSNVGSFLLSFFLVFFAIYYLLRDGVKIKNYFNSIFPLSREHENLLLSKLSAAVNGVVKGMFLVALAQGAVATIGFLIFGVPQPFLWGAFTVLAALVPTVGTSLSLIPAILYLLIIGSVGPGVGLAIWGFLAVGTIDNILSPKLIGSRTNLHPVLVLFSVLGGVHLFGFMGFLLGPIVMAVFVALLEVYRTDLKEYMGR